MINCKVLLPGVMSVVLEAGVDEAVVGGNEAVLVAAVEVHAVGVEEQTVSGEVKSKPQRKRDIWEKI